MATEIGDQQHSHKVFLLPKDLIDVNSDGQDSSIIKLPHSRTGTLSLFLFHHTKNQILEIVQFSDSYRSWFIGNLVEKEGCMFLTTPIDPLFLIIPYLKQNTNFCPLSDIFDEEYPDTKYLIDCLSSYDINCISEHKAIEDGPVYRYSEERTLNWLQQKVKKVAELLEKKNICVSEGSKAATLIQKRLRNSEETYLHYACQLVSEYLDEDLASKLLRFLNLPQNCSNNERQLNNAEHKPSPKKAKLEEPVTPLEDYSKTVKWETKKTSSAKLTTAQKQLKKVDKTGMKSISSFFGKKS